VQPWPPENLVALDGSATAWCGGGAPPTLRPILDAAEQLAPGSHVGICVASSDNTYTTLAGTDPLVFMLDDMQYALDEGPGITAIREGHTVIVDDAESEHRWPRFMSIAVDLGLRSHLGMPISVEGRTLGGLNMYSTVHASVDAGRLAHARLLAAQAAIALDAARRENDLVLALQSSRTIGKAIGLVMERFNLDDHEAFAHLTKLSQRSSVALRDIAAHLVKQSNDLRHLTQARQPRHQERSPGLTLVPRLDGLDDQELDAIAYVGPLTDSTVHGDDPTLLSEV
jgi:GAF domain-containing protein